MVSLSLWRSTHQWSPSIGSMLRAFWVASSWEGPFLGLRHRGSSKPLSLVLKSCWLLYWNLATIRLGWWLISQQNYLWNGFPRCRKDSRAPEKPFKGHLLLPFLRNNLWRPLAIAWFMSMCLSWAALKFYYWFCLSLPKLPPEAC